MIETIAFDVAGIMGLTYNLFPYYLFPYDFCYLWASGRIALFGGNVYDPDLLVQVMRASGWPQHEGAWGFTHPPWTIWLYIPFALFPLKVAAVLWLSLQAVILVYIARSLLKFARSSNLNIISFPEHLAVTSILLFPPIVKIFVFGQMSLFLTLGLVMFANLARKNSPLEAGLALSLTLMKPHLLVPVYICLVLHARQLFIRQILLGMTGGFFIQLLLSWLLYHDGLRYYADYVPLLVEKSLTLNGVTLAQICYRLWGISWVRPLFIAIGVIIGISWDLKKPLSLEKLLYVLVPISLLLTPYSFSHEFVLLLPAYIHCLAIAFNRITWRVSYIIAAISIIDLIILVNIEYEPITIILPVGILIGEVLIYRSTHGFSTGKVFK